MAVHNETGDEGEQIAVKWLLNQEYVILERNYRFKRDEVDIIASKDDLIIFIEVKTRSNNYLGEPEEAVSISKQKRIIKVANHYMMDNDLENEARFDIFGIILNKTTKNIHHIEGAFTPTW